MKFKILLTTAVLALAPALASAAGCSTHTDQQVMTCADGMSYDAESGKCMVMSS